MNFQLLLGISLMTTTVISAPIERIYRCNVEICTNGCHHNYCNVGKCRFGLCACFECNHTMTQIVAPSIVPDNVDETLYDEFNGAPPTSPPTPCDLVSCSEKCLKVRCFAADCKTGKCGCSKCH